MEKDKKCIECGSTDKLLQLQNGYYACKNCLDTLGKEQREIQEYITNYISENFQINNPETQAKTLEAIAKCIRYNNGLLSEKEIEEINKEKERMEKAFE